MQIVPANELVTKKCLPCEGGVDPCPLDFSRKQLQQLPQWHLSEDEKWIIRKIRCKNFVDAVERINKIADLAESEAHHPDLHLTGYRELKIEISTHAIGGLSENDFILASKIDQLLDKA